MLTKPAVGGTPIKVPGYFKMRSRFVDFSGLYVMHCHILAHEDRGMMTVVQVAPLTPPPMMAMVRSRKGIPDKPTRALLNCAPAKPNATPLMVAPDRRKGQSRHATRLVPLSPAGNETRRFGFPPACAFRDG